MKKKFGALVKAKRQKTGMTQALLSTRTKVPQPEISKIESGRVKSPTLDVALKLSKELDIDLNGFK